MNSDYESFVEHQTKAIAETFLLELPFLLMMEVLFVPPPIESALGLIVDRELAEQIERKSPAG